ncbi:hypothetical protein FI667_g2005, partial [Globisporangium splendens]
MSGDPLRDFFAVGPTPATAYDRFFHASSSSTLATPHCLGSLYQHHTATSAASCPPRGVQSHLPPPPAQLAPNSAENPIDLTVRKRRAKNCATTGCSRIGKANGLCLRHQGPRCAVRGCTKLAARGNERRCKSHAVRKRCQFSGCNKKINAKESFCKAHDGRRCRQEGCDARVNEPNGVCSQHVEAQEPHQEEEINRPAAEDQDSGHSSDREGAAESGPCADHTERSPESSVNESAGPEPPRNSADGRDSGQSPREDNAVPSELSAHDPEQSSEAASSEPESSERPRTSSPQATESEATS